VPYQHTFLTKKLRDYLEKDRKNMNSRDRAVYDFHLRKMLKDSLKDVVCVFEKLDKKQFDKISKETEILIVELLSTFAKRSVEPYGKSPYGRILKHRAFKVLTRQKEGGVLMNINRSAFDRIYGEKRIKESTDKTEVVCKSGSDKEER